MYEEIKEKFNSVISYSQEISNPKTDELFERWYQAKKEYIQLFGNKLIWEWPEKISFELDEKSKEDKISTFIDKVYYNYNNPNLSDFIQAQKDGFFSNTVVKDWTDKDGNTISKGMKLSKAFKFFEKDKKLLNDLQSEASRIIQENKIEGTLCLSVHPLDFLSSSENRHNWRSCHSLDGEYRSGNLSYMVDSSTIICYLRSDKETILPNFPNDVLWNSKKWRMLLFFSTDGNLIFAGRQYPFSSSVGLNFITERIFPALRLGEWTNWTKKKIKNFSDGDVKFYFSNSYIPIGNDLKKLTEVIFDADGSLHFNDLLCSSCYDPYYAFKKREAFFNKTEAFCYFDEHLSIGGKVTCLRCGKNNIEFPETMMCNNCELEYGDGQSEVFRYCDCCGARYISDEGLWLQEYDEEICPDCARSQVGVCENCGEDFYIEDLYYNKKRQIWVCKYCEEGID